MSKKIGFVVASTGFLVIALFNTPMLFAQISWDVVQISAYGTDLVQGDTIAEQLSFIVVAPPPGSEITNTMYVLNEDSGENYTKTLSPGDFVGITYIDYSPSIETTAGSEPNHWIISYDGGARSARINYTDIPEFSPILIVPMFIAATLLALVYRRKRTSQK